MTCTALLNPRGNTRECSILFYDRFINEKTSADLCSYSQNRRVAYSKRRAGDAVFFGGACDCSGDPESIHHVSLMMNSGTKMWNALKTGTDVREDDFGNWDEKACPYVIRFS